MPAPQRLLIPTPPGIRSPQDELQDHAAQLGLTAAWGRDLEEHTQTVSFASHWETPNRNSQSTQQPLRPLISPVASQPEQHVLDTGVPVTRPELPVVETVEDSSQNDRTGVILETS